MTVRKKKEPAKKGANKDFLIYELKLLLIIGFTVLSIFSLHTDAAGSLGKGIKGAYLGLFSYAGYTLPYVFFTLLFLGINRNKKINKIRYAFAALSFFVSAVIFVGLITHGKDAGIIGNYMGSLIIKNIGLAGGYIVSLMLLFGAIIAGSNMTLEKMFKGTSQAAAKSGKLIADNGKKVLKEIENRNDGLQENDDPTESEHDEGVLYPQFRMPKSLKKFDYDQYDTKEKDLNPNKGFDMFEPEEPIKPIAPVIEKNEKIMDDLGQLSDYDEIDYNGLILTDEIIEEEEKILVSEIHKFEEHVKKMDYKLPPIDLLEIPKPQKGTDKKELFVKAKLLEDTLKNFGVDVKVVQITRGPSVTMFELQPSPGVKVSKIVGLSDDIALSLAATQVRIIAPIPGKSAVGVEIPNEETSIVVMREIIESPEYTNNKSKLTFALGKDIQGTSVIGDLSKMPHLLIAGATGSGKSVCVNTFIASILYNSNPDEVKFLMIDPKVVELSIYNGIPHLLLPVVTDPKKAAIALNWAVQEMTRRYGLFAENQVRDVNSFNDKADGVEIEKMPKIVVIIDELADLMMVAPNQIEDSICRLAQMARAAGIHLLVATQRPSVDVITGLIKANIPSRIAFAVSSQTDSRTILDMGGAEKLLGKGDMLYFPVGISKPIRVQGAFISDSEVSRVVEFVSGQDHALDYNDEILDSNNMVQSEPTDADDLLADAIEHVVRSKQASASMLQRKYRIGYNRAARIVEQMEERGVVGPSLGSKPREVLITESEFESMDKEY